MEPYLGITWKHIGGTLEALLRRSSLHGAMAAIDGDSWQGPDYMGTAAHVPFSPLAQRMAKMECR